jgi:hypothetical protein
MKIDHLDKARVLSALYHASSVRGLGALAAWGAPEVDRAHCLDLLAEYPYFDYLYGRVMKVRMDTDDLDLRLYNRDNGWRAGERAICKEFGLPVYVDCRQQTDEILLSTDAQDFRQRYVYPKAVELEAYDSIIDTRVELVTDLRVDYRCTVCETSYYTWREPYEPVRPLDCPLCGCRYRNMRASVARR